MSEQRVVRIIQFYEFTDGTWDGVCSWLGGVPSPDVLRVQAPSWAQAHEELSALIELRESALDN